MNQHLVRVIVLLSAAPAFAGTIFVPGNLVVSVEGCGVEGGTCTGVLNGTGAGGGYGDNQAAPLSLFQFTTGGTYLNTLVLPQTGLGSNLPVSGEYGSSSEATLQLSGNGAYLTVMGYGINADTFNASPATYSILSTNTALAQSGSQTGQSYTPIARVATTINSDGNVNSATGIFNLFNGNNPRSVYTVDGSSFYMSGQGNSPDATGGVFYALAGSNSAVTITGADAGSGDSQDTREVQVYDNQLYVSTDSKEGSTNRSYVGTLGTAGSLPTSVANGGNGPTQLPGTGTSTGKYTITATNGNSINSAGEQINLSPENYFFANPSTLYIADSGDGKQDSATSTLGDGGLQKWVNSKADGSGTWTLEYTISSGLNLVVNTSGDGTSGLLGLTGEVVDIDGVDDVELFATNFTLADLDQTYLYAVTDPLYATTDVGETFTELAAAPSDSDFKGVSFAPAPEPASFALLGLGCVALLVISRRNRSLYSNFRVSKSGKADPCGVPGSSAGAVRG